MLNAMQKVKITTKCQWLYGGEKIPLEQPINLLEILFHFIYLFDEIAVDDNVLKIRQQQSNFYRWIEAYRTHAHRIAQTNPIELKNNTR